MPEADGTSTERVSEPVILTGASGAQYELGASIGSFGDTPASECDAPDGGRYYGPGDTIVCRCIVCSRCGKHTGNSTQGHFWAYCSVTLSKRDFHMCCPDNCELEASRPAVSEERAEEVRAGLNGFITRIGDDVFDNLDDALAWAEKQEDVETYALGYSVLNGPCVTLTDGTVISFTGSLWEFAAGTGGGQ